MFCNQNEVPHKDVDHDINGGNKDKVAWVFEEVEVAFERQGVDHWEGYHLCEQVRVQVPGGGVVVWVTLGHPMGDKK